MSKPVTASTPLGTLIRNVPTGFVGRLTVSPSEQYGTLGWRVGQEATDRFGGTEFFEIVRCGRHALGTCIGTGNECVTA